MRKLLCLFLLSLPLLSQAQSIGFLMDDYKSERWLQDSIIFYNEVSNAGLETSIFWCYSDPEIQFTQAKTAIDSHGVNVLVLVSSHADKNVNIVEYARSKNVPVILYDRLVNTSADFYVSFENKEIGRIQARYMLEQVPKGNYVLVNGPTYDNNALLFRQGQMEVLQPEIASGNVNIVYDQHMKHWTDVEAFEEMSNLFVSSTEPIDGIICANDGMAAGIIDAIDLFYDGLHLPLTGQDGMPKAIEFIKSGKQSMTVRKPIENIAKTAARLAVDLAKGNDSELPGTTLMYGDHQTTFIKVGFEIITQETLPDSQSSAK